MNMLGHNKIADLGATIAVTAALMLGTAAQSQAETGAVRIKITKVGFLMGVAGGSGTLTYKGHHYRLSIGGISAGTIGVASAELVGRAYNLRQPADITGTYTAVSASVAVAGGAKAAKLKNSKGVVLELSGKEIGLELSASLSGMSVSLK
jgi:hypothetical protein